MKTLKSILSVLLSLTLVLSLAGCGASKIDYENFSYSDGITDDGYWKGVEALKHVTLCNYSSIEIPAETHNIDPAVIQEEMDSIVSSFASYEKITDRAVVDGDTVNIAYTGTIDGVVFEGGSTGATGTEVTIGVTNYIDDFLEQLIGHYPGETFNIEVTFPDDYGKEELNGKDAVFSTMINYIAGEPIIPELTDAFVAENLTQSYGWTTVEEMRQDITDFRQQEAISAYVERYIVESSEIKSVPDEVLTYQKNSLLNYYNEYAIAYGMKLEDFLSQYLNIKSVDDCLEQNAEMINSAADFYLVIQAIAEDMKMTATEADVVNYFRDYMGISDYSDHKEHFGMPYLKMTTLTQKVMDSVIKNVKLA